MQLPREWSIEGRLVRSARVLEPGGLLRSSSYGGIKLRLFQELVDVRRSHHIDPGIHNGRNSFSFGEVVQDVDALNTHRVRPLADQTIARSLFQNLELLRQGIESDDHKFLRFDVVKVLRDCSQVGLGSAEKRPTTGKEKPVKIRIPGQSILDNLDRFRSVVVAGERRTREFGIFASGFLKGLAESVAALIVVYRCQAAGYHREFAFR